MDAPIENNIAAVGLDDERENRKGALMQRRPKKLDMNTARPTELDIATPQQTHGFKDPADLRMVTGDDPLLLELIETPAFQRLKTIRFLGAIDYRLVPRPNGKPKTTRYTRYQHSLGVMQLARSYCIHRNLNLPDRQLVCVAALLHDIGHPPLSHSMEPVFKEEFGIDHHRATEDIICGRARLGKEILGTLRCHGIDVEKLIVVISGDDDTFDGFFHGPINFDTIEGILRSCMYTQRAPTVPSPNLVAEAAMDRRTPADRDIVDKFWQHKDWVYKNIINSHDGILSDLVCRISLRRNLHRINLNTYFGTESGMFRRLPGLRPILTSRSFRKEVAQMVDEPVHYIARDYFIDHNGDFFARRDKFRYQVSRRRRTLKLGVDLRSAAVDEKSEMQGALLDDAL